MVTQLGDRVDQAPTPRGVETRFIGIPFRVTLGVIVIGTTITKVCKQSSREILLGIFMALQLTPLIYPPTMFCIKSRVQYKFVEKYFPINYLREKIILAPPITQNSREYSAASRTLKNQTSSRHRALEGVGKGYSVPVDFLVRCFSDTEAYRH